MYIKLDQGWDIIQEGIAKFIRILEAFPDEQQFTSEEIMLIYTTIHDMCTQKPPHCYRQQLYDKYREVFEDYITSTVLPALREKHDEFMLRELLKRWINHKVMDSWLTRRFHFLDRYFIPRNFLPGLHEVGLACFRDLICKEEINGKVKDAVISLIDQDSEGEQIDRALLKNILDIFVEIEMGLEEYSRPDYMLKAEDCLKKEKDRVEKAQHQLADLQLEKENSGSHALLQDDKHVASEGTSLVKQAEDAASNKKELGLHEQSL